MVHVSSTRRLMEVAILAILLQLGIANHLISQFGGN